MTAGSFHPLLKDVLPDTSFQHHNLSASFKTTIDHVDLSSMRYMSSFLCSGCFLAVVTCVMPPSKSRTFALKISSLALSPRWTAFHQFNCLWSIARQGGKIAAFEYRRYLWFHSCVRFASMHSVELGGCLNTSNSNWQCLAHSFQLSQC